MELLVATLGLFSAVLAALTAWFAFSDAMEVRLLFKKTYFPNSR